MNKPQTVSISLRTGIPSRDRRFFIVQTCLTKYHQSPHICWYFGWYSGAPTRKVPTQHPDTSWH